MELAAIIISAISLLTSGYVAYVAFLKGPNPEMIVGTKFYIYPAPFLSQDGLTWGGVGFYIPITFHNWSPKGGSIIEVRIAIRRKDDPSTVFDMSWNEFAKMLEDQRRWGHEGTAQPIPLQGRSSESKVIQFAWLPISEKDFEVKSGRYNISIYAWTKAREKPNLKESFEFLIKDEQVQEFQKAKENKNTLTIELALRENKRTNSILTESEFKQLYE
jgi:hypothetical protein